MRRVLLWLGGVIAGLGLILAVLWDAGHYAYNVPPIAFGESVYEGETITLRWDAGEVLREARTTYTDRRMDVVVSRGEPTERTVPGYWIGTANELSHNNTGRSGGSYFAAHIRTNARDIGRLPLTLRYCAGRGVAWADDPESDAFRCKFWSHYFYVTPKDGFYSYSVSDYFEPEPWHAFSARRGDELVSQKGRYLAFPDGSVFLKTGAGSPENLLAYSVFDGTYSAGGIGFPALGDDQLHDFAPHVADWREGDPDWGDGAGKGIVGLFNYYAEVGVNSQYLVAMNVEGDGQDVFPWVSHDDPYTFDVSKLAQWQTVLQHANDKGVLIHFLFTETENESWFEAFDGVEVGESFSDARKLYYREMIARFGHLPMLVWNLGEENGVVGNTGADPYRQPTSPTQRAAFADYIRAIDPYDHPIVAHNWPDAEEEVYGALLGHESFSGISLQAHHGYFDKAAAWTTRSAEAGRPWMVSVDEPLGWEFGARPDDQSPERRPEIVDVLWPSLLGGAAGVEWYFGWQNNAPTSDLSNEDQRTRDRLFRQSAKVSRFFETLPLAEMQPRREGEAIILKGVGHVLRMEGGILTYTAPGQGPRQLDPYDP